MTPDEIFARRIHEARSLEELARPLEALLSGNFAVWTDGRLLSIKRLVARIEGLKIEIYPREHPPPHFHVRARGINASFSVVDCAHLEGKISRRDQDLVRWWHTHSRRQLVAIWNSTRPSDCPVGPIESEPAA